MHIPDGVLPAPLVLAGYAGTGLATWYSLRQINRFENPQAAVPKASLLTAAFFVASWIHIPVPPTSVHLILNGLLGTLLGYFAFPAILIGLLFQAVMFQHGGLSTLGINALMMGIPAIAAHYIFRLRYRLKLTQARSLAVLGFFSGAIGLGLAVLIFFSLLIIFLPAGFNPQTERTAIAGLALAHLPVVVLEGFFTALLVSFIYRVKPELLPQQ
ncbi:MAG: cobalt transporter CbiM [Leptolyngbya sp. SIO4C5]|uniref:cobalt transporter CbiM n=1 Tax=Sphaerothrix gracilis TaxID=3151835 RepID=UPI0013C223D9|nr:cobalt transporter CbiM [Leptolyngbya sp. SIO4C5]